MSDTMLHGVLNMPLPADPAQMDLVTWLQFRGRARQASQRIERDAAVIAAADALAREVAIFSIRQSFTALHVALAAYNKAKEAKE